MPIPIESDHVAIAKPREVGDLIYARTRDFLANNIFKQAKAARRRGPVEIPTRPPVTAEVPNTWVPHAIRIAALLMVAFIGFKGIQATFWPPDPLKAATAQQIEQALRYQYPDATPEQIDRFMQSLRDARGEPTFEKAVEQAEKGNPRVAQGIWRQIYDNEDKLADEGRKNKAKAARNLAAAADPDAYGEELALLCKVRSLAVLSEGRIRTISPIGRQPASELTRTKLRLTDGLGVDGIGLRAGLTDEYQRAPDFDLKIIGHTIP